MEAIGGALLEDAPAVDEAADAGAFERLMTDLEAQPPLTEPAPAAPIDPAMAMIPRPLRDRLPAAPEALTWRRQGPVEMVFLPCDMAGHRVRLLRIAPGRSVPRHTHRGSELTLVLEGAFSDATGRFVRGDIESADGSLDHQPVADGSGPCMCLAVTSAPLRLTGLLGRIIDPFLDI